MSSMLRAPSSLRASCRSTPAAGVSNVRRVVLRRSASPSPEQLQQMMQDPAMAERLRAMQEQLQRDPAMQQRLQQMMQSPEMQQQLAQMQAYMQNQALQQRMQELRSDPEFKEMFEDIQKNPQKLMQYMNDPKVLAKLGQRLGDIDPTAGGAAATAAAGGGGAAAAAPVMPSGPEVNDLFDAAKYGDLEAVEDFIAIGKDVNSKDSQQRTPLHFAAGFGHSGIAQLLLDEGAELEAADSQGNTPLHYAAGYGRPELVELLLAKGASPAAKNSNGKTPVEVAGLNPNNPIMQSEELLAKLAPN